MEAARGRFDLQVVLDVVPLTGWALKVRDVLAQVHPQASIGVVVGEIGMFLFEKALIKCNRKDFGSISTSPVLWREKW